MTNKLTSSTPKGYKLTKIGVLPVKWKVKYFKDIINIRSGQVDPKEEPYASMFLVAPNHIESGSGAIAEYETAKTQGAISGKYEVQAGDIIYSKIRPYLKKAAIAKVNCICSADMYAIDGIGATNEYLLSAILGGHFTNYANSVSARTGMPKINRQDLLAYKIPLPPLPQQQKIAKILSTWDDAIRLQTQLITAKKEQKRGLMQRLLIGKVRLNGFEKSMEKVKSRIGDVPADWEIIPAGQLFKSSSKKKNGEMPLLAVTQENGVIDRNDLEGRVTMPSGSTEGYKLIEEGDFVISLRSFQGGLEYSEIMGIVSPAYTILKNIREIDKSFFKFYFKSHEFIQRLAATVIGIRDGKQISYKDFVTLKFRLPPLPEQTAIANILTTADREITLLETRLTELREQKRGLMQRLLTGQVRVDVTD